MRGSSRVARYSAVPSHEALSQMTISLVNGEVWSRTFSTHFLRRSTRLWVSTTTAIPSLSTPPSRAGAAPESAAGSIHTMVERSLTLSDGRAVLVLCDRLHRQRARNGADPEAGSHGRRQVDGLLDERSNRLGPDGR